MEREDSSDGTGRLPHRVGVPRDQSAYFSRRGAGIRSGRVPERGKGCLDFTGIGVADNAHQPGPRIGVRPGGQPLGPMKDPLYALNENAFTGIRDTEQSLAP